MGVFVYECAMCGEQEERDRPVPPCSTLPACPKCGAEMLRKWQPLNVIYKGPGFYSTDNRKENDNG